MRVIALLLMALLLILTALLFLLVFLLILVLLLFVRVFLFLLFIMKPLYSHFLYLELCSEAATVDRIGLRIWYNGGMIEIKNVSKHYGAKKALDNISFEVNRGEIFAFIGHNGAGKTTLIKSICGILDFEKGEILINGKSIKNDPIACKKEMAYIPDDPELYEDMKAISFINFVCDMYNTPIEVREKNVTRYAKMFGMENELGNTIKSFSHGMKQKVAIIAALSHEPNVLIMDEPFVGLDPKAIFDMKEVMHEIVKDGGTIFFSTHILDMAEKLCDRVAIVENGQIVKVGDMKKIRGDESLEKVFLELGVKS